MKSMGKWVAAAVVALMAAGQAQAIVINAVGNSNGNGTIDGNIGATIDLGFTDTEVSLSKDYTSTGDMFLEIVTSGPTTFILQEDIANNTGIDWTDFHWELEAVQSGTARFTGISDPGPFGSTMVMDNAIWLDDGVLPDGGVLVTELTIQTDVSAIIRIRQFPTFDNAVPEPISAALGMLGLATLGLATRRRTA